MAAQTIIDMPLSTDAIVIEKTANGVIVRPHSWSWAQRSDTRDYFFGVQSVLVFNDFERFAQWLKDYFPAAPVTNQDAR